MSLRKIHTYLIGLAITLALVLPLCLPGFAVSAAGSGVVSVSAPAQPVSPGQQFTVNVTVQPGSAIAGAQFDLSFNPSLVSVNGITGGNLFNQDGSGAYFMPGTINNTIGTITGVAGTITSPGQTVSTAGTLAVITMTAGTSGGTSSLNLSDVIMGDIDGQPVPVTTENGQVIINGGTTTTTTTTTTTSAPPSAGGGGGGGGGPQDLTVNMGVSGLNPSLDITLNLLGQTSGLNELNFSNGLGTIKILAGTSLLDRFGNPLTTFSVQKLDTLPAPPDGDTLLLGYEFGPSGARFNPAITITLKYDPRVLPAGADATDLQVAYWNGISWQVVATTVDTDLDTITFSTTHFTTFAVLYPGIIAPTTTTTSNVVTTTTPVSTTTSTLSSATTSPPAPTTTETTVPVSTPTSTLTETSITSQPGMETTASTIPSSSTTAAETTMESPVTPVSTTTQVSSYRLFILAVSVGIAIFLILVTVAYILARRHKLLHNR